MPLSQQLELDPDPSAARTARAWVIELLARLGRDDLAESAELGVSELVTNALLHAEPPVRLRLRGTRDHPRIEVLDCSSSLPASAGATGGEDQLGNGGRGLDLVALFSRAWGSVVDSTGKLVWFEPTSAEPDGEPVVGHHVVNEDTFATEPEVAGERIAVQLLNFPVQEWAHFRAMYTELRRELRLLAITHPDDYPLATELTELARTVDGHRLHSTGLAKLEAAIEAGQTTADLTYEVPVTSVHDMPRLASLLREAVRFCHEQNLLASAPLEEHVELVVWYADQFVQQAAGREASPWRGAARSA